ncbi:MAG: TRAP transporter substrate-binding protein [Notoacmeibacter sp.]|nr:TRAP transporter substrate-binding protein [Notoacmeibacter sp.]
MAVAAAFACSFAFTSNAVATELRLASAAPAKSVWATQLKRYADKVAELSDGKLTIDIFPGGELGNMIDTWKMMLGGRLDIWNGVTLLAATVTPELGTLTLPYIVNDYDEFKCMIPKLETEMATAAGDKYQILAAQPVGAQSLGLVKEAHKPSDLAGRKLRSAPTPAVVEFWKSIGATPQALPESEIAPALSTGLVEGSDQSSIYYVATGANKSAPYLLQTRHVFNLGILAVSAKTWASLTDSEKQIMKDATSSWNFPEMVDEVMAFEKMLLDSHVKGGGHIIELTEDEAKEWRAAGQATWDYGVGQLGGQSKAFMTSIEEARASCAK